MSWWCLSWTTSHEMTLVGLPKVCLAVCFEAYNYRSVRRTGDQCPMINSQDGQTPAGKTPLCWYDVHPDKQIFINVQTVSFLRHVHCYLLNWTRHSSTNGRCGNLWTATWSCLESRRYSIIIWWNTMVPSPNLAVSSPIQGFWSLATSLS